jgi:SNF2 domain protein|nr:MAG TPA: Helicase of the snf2 rad54 family [Caudoviricetes sp.]DAR99105.1 MAG TPA: Helicase of the snf2 rad54 family [Caudoviricetes sp.]
MNESNLHGYQKTAVNHIIKNPYSSLLLDMGLGKTVSTLTAINRLINYSFEVVKVLVIAPLRVAENTWGDECEKWEHLKDLKISKVLGSEKKRNEALAVNADIYIINRENVAWLVATHGYLFRNRFFDMVVIDELSSFKSSKSTRWKALKSVRPFISRVVGLTGTPAPNGYIDLWAQMYLIDMGERLGKFITRYRETYFSSIGRGDIVFRYDLREGSQNKINSLISDICISMKAEDYLQLPKRLDYFEKVDLGKFKKSYDKFERDCVLELFADDSETITAASAAALSNKLLQFSGGAVYDEERNAHLIHSKKLEALEDIVEAANGEPILLFYAFKHEERRIIEHFKGLKVVKLDGTDTIEAWNKGEIDIAIAHPASVGHGLNLQHGGNIIVWYGLTWSLELYQQANARLHRQGQTKPVKIYHLISKGTIDEEVVNSLNKKDKTQESLMQAVKARINRYL